MAIKALFLIVLMGILILIPSSFSAEADNTVSIEITPGPFVTELAEYEDQLILTVDDLTGSGQGWRVMVLCSQGSAIPIGDVEAIAGQTPDATFGPKIIGSAFTAEPEYGMGRYQQRFQKPEEGKCLLLTYPQQ